MDELDKEQFLLPYRKVAAIHELQESNYLVQLYLNCYEKHYKAKFIFPLGNAHLTTIQDIKKQAGDKTPRLIEHYFKMKDHWFVSQTHSLDCLKKNLNKVNSDYEKRSPTEISSSSIVLRIHLACDKCERAFWWQGKSQELDQERLCEDCKGIAKR